MRERKTVSADRGGIAAGSNVLIGISPQDLPAIIDAATGPLERLTAEQKELIVDLEHRLGASEAQLFAFFRIIGEAHIAPERMGERLVEIAEQHKALLAGVKPDPADDPSVADLKAEARSALKAGDLVRADTHLASVETAKAAELGRLSLEIAAIRAQRGEIALTRLRYREAAKHFAAAAARVPLGNEE